MKNQKQAFRTLNDVPKELRLKVVCPNCQTENSWRRTKCRITSCQEPLEHEYVIDDNLPEISEEAPISLPVYNPQPDDAHPVLQKEYRERYAEMCELFQQAFFELEELRTAMGIHEGRSEKFDELKLQLDSMKQTVESIEDHLTRQQEDDQQPQAAEIQSLAIQLQEEPPALDVEPAPVSDSASAQVAGEDVREIPAWLEELGNPVTPSVEDPPLAEESDWAVQLQEERSVEVPTEVSDEVTSQEEPGTLEQTVPVEEPVLAGQTDFEFNPLKDAKTAPAGQLPTDTIVRKPLVDEPLHKLFPLIFERIKNRKKGRKVV